MHTLNRLFPTSFVCFFFLYLELSSVLDAKFYKGIATTIWEFYKIITPRQGNPSTA